MRVLIGTSENDGLAEAPPTEYEIETPEQLLSILAEEWGDPPSIGSTVTMERVA